MDKVIVNGLRFHAKHGCHPEERNTGGVFEVDIIVDTDFTPAIEKDQIALAIDYVTLMTIAKTEMEQPRNLIETVAEAIGSAILSHYQIAKRCEITLKKLHPPVSFDLSYVAVKTIVDRSQNN